MGFKLGGRYTLKVLPSVEDYEEIDTGAGFIEEMWQFRGHALLVTGAYNGSNPRLSLPNGNEWYFSPNWLEPVNKFKGNK